MNFIVVKMQGWVFEIYWSLYDVLDVVNKVEVFFIRYVVVCNFFVLIQFCYVFIFFIFEVVNFILGYCILKMYNWFDFIIVDCWSIFCILEELEFLCSIG